MRCVTIFCLYWCDPFARYFDAELDNRATGNQPKPLLPVGAVFDAAFPFMWGDGNFLRWNAVSLNQARHHEIGCHGVGGAIPEHLVEQGGGVNAKWCVCVLGGATVVFHKFSPGRAHSFSEPGVVSLCSHPFGHS